VQTIRSNVLKKENNNNLRMFSNTRQTIQTSVFVSYDDQLRCVHPLA